MCGICAMSTSVCPEPSAKRISAGKGRRIVCWVLPLISATRTKTRATAVCCSVRPEFFSTQHVRLVVIVGKDRQ